MTGHPWSILDLTPGATLQDIRKAYAKKLKVIRPDEDAAGFQNLVSARDLALLLAERSNTAVASNWETVSTLPVSVVAAYEESLVDPIATERQPPVSLASTRLLDLGAFDVAETSFSPTELEARLVKLANSSVTYFDLDGWQDLLFRLSNCPATLRGRLEPSIIGSFWNILKGCQGKPSLPHVPSDAKDRKLITLYDEEFGWSENDRKVYATLGGSAGDEFKWRLSEIWAEQYPQHELGKRGLALRAERRRLARMRQVRREVNIDQRLVWVIMTALFFIFYGFSGMH